MEMDILGVHLSSTPFDVINRRYGDKVLRFTQVDELAVFEDFCVAGVVKRSIERVDRNGNPFGIVTLFAQDGTLDAMCFSSAWRSCKSRLGTGDTVLARVDKDNSGRYKIVGTVNAELSDG